MQQARTRTPVRTSREHRTIRADLETPWLEQWPHHYGDLVRYASHLLSGDLQAAEDVAQETAIRLWQHPEVITDDQPLGGWLRTVARNIIIDRSRRKRARPTEVALTPGTDAPGRQDADHTDHVDAVSSVTALLAGLSTPHRAAVFEVYVRDRPISDVAGDLGVPVGTIKSRCHNALRKLRAANPVPPLDYA